MGNFESPENRIETKRKSLKSFKYENIANH